MYAYISIKIQKYIQKNVYIDTDDEKLWKADTNTHMYQT